MNRIKEVDILKGICILYVILGHLSPAMFIEKHIYSFHMFMFFFISGLLFKSNTSLKKAIIGKAKSLLIPYFLWNSISIMLSLILKDYSLIDAVNYLFSINGKPSWNAPIWFLLVLFETDILFRLLSKNKYLHVISIVISLVCGFFTQDTLYIFCLNILPVAYFFYSMGYLTKKYGVIDKVMNSKTKTKVLVIIMSLIINIIFGNVLNTRISVINSYYGNYIYAIIAGIAGIIAYSIIAFVIKRSDLLQYFGRNTLIILCSQYWIFRAMDLISFRAIGISLWHERSTLKAVIITIVVCIMYRVSIPIKEKTLIKLTKYSRPYVT